MQFQKQGQAHGHQRVGADAAVLHDAQDLDAAPAAPKSVKAVRQPVLVETAWVPNRRGQYSNWH